MSKTSMPHTCLSIRLAGVAAVVAGLGAPLAASAQGSNAQQLYREAMQACNSGQSTQSRRDCMYEARSVLRDAREGRAWTRDGGDLGSRADRDSPSARRQDGGMNDRMQGSQQRSGARQDGQRGSMQRGQDGGAMQGSDAGSSQGTRPQR